MIATNVPFIGYKVITDTPIAVLHKWYSLVKEKRQPRLDFIRTITKAFDVDSTKLAAAQDDIDFVRFMVENFSSFDYKLQEEVFSVIRAATNVLSVAGMQMMEILAPSDLMKQLEGTNMVCICFLCQIWIETDNESSRREV
jgi:cohesin loading factor subunit SCC2